MAQQLNKDMVIWVDDDVNISQYASIVKKSGFAVKSFNQTADCINYISHNAHKQRIVGIITSMMERGNRKANGLKNGIEMIQYINKHLLSSMIVIPIFAICSSSVNKNECRLKYKYIKVVIKSSDYVNPRNQVQIQLLKQLQNNNNNNNVILWVDTNPNVIKLQNIFKTKNYQLKYFGETQNCIDYVNINHKNVNILGVITCMMRSGGRKQKGLRDGLQMIDNIRASLLSFGSGYNTIYAIVSSSCNEYECKQHGVDIIVNSSKISNSWNYVTQQLFIEIANNNLKQKVIVIGISGATRSGKGTLAKKLQLHFGGNICTTLCQDRYFDRNIIYKQLGGNWDHPQAINHNAFLFNVNKRIKENKYKYIILEGFLLFHDQRIVKLIDFSFWLEISKNECYLRRMKTKAVPESYFHTKLWPNYVSYKNKVFKDKLLASQLVKIDGTQNPVIITQNVVKQLQ